MSETAEGRVLYLAVPCYNEEEVLPETVRILSEKLAALERGGKIAPESRMMLINDGSKDGTWALMERAFAENPRVTLVNLSRNRGHQNALLAGLMTAKDYADAVISLDADLQDDVDAIDRMVDEWTAGADIVYGVRSSRAADTAFKRGTAQTYYKVLKGMGVETVYNHADFRLMTKRALEALSEYKEVNLYLRGLVPMIGFRTATVEYERKERMAGESKYPLKKMLALAWEGITSSTGKPLRWIAVIGAVTAFLAFVYLIYALIAHFAGATVDGWTTLAVLVCFFGGAQILCIGIIGEYISKIYWETKSRPRYIIQDLKLQ